MARSPHAAGGVERRVLKRDALGRVELWSCGEARCIARIACGGRLPGSAWLARRLARREARALRCLDGLPGVPRARAQPFPPSGAPAAAGTAPPARGSARATPGALPGAWPESGAGREVFLREHLEGEPLHRARELPVDFFRRLAELVTELHARGVCHNDLHKEQNVLVAPDGRPALIDFQLASVHARRGRSFEVRAREDLRHVAKHWRRYTRGERAPGPAWDAPPVPARAPRSLAARVWRRLGKPIYLAVTRGILGTRDGEERRASPGPWPRWTSHLGPRATADGSGRGRPAPRD